MFIIEWIEIPVSYILYFWHLIISPIFGAASGLTWVLSIVGLVVVIRILLIPLFVKQIKAQRGMQLIQPKMKEIQKKYAGDREKQSAEMMKLYKETGTNPLASCLPIGLDLRLQRLGAIARAPLANVWRWIKHWKFNTHLPTP